MILSLRGPRGRAAPLPPHARGYASGPLQGRRGAAPHQVSMRLHIPAPGEGGDPLQLAHLAAGLLACGGDGAAAGRSSRQASSVTPMATAASCIAARRAVDSRATAAFMIAASGMTRAHARYHNTRCQPSRPAPVSGTRLVPLCSAADDGRYWGVPAAGTAGSEAAGRGSRLVAPANDHQSCGGGAAHAPPPRRPNHGQAA